MTTNIRLTTYSDLQLVMEIYETAREFMHRAGNINQCTIHRIASSGIEKGVGEACFKWSFTQISNIRVDTHRDNKVMQNILPKLDFEYCGIIYLLDGSERLAYQKAL